jgi:hypothetical protein
MAENYTQTTDLGTSDYLLHKMVSARLLPYYEKKRVFSGLLGEENRIEVPPGSYSIEVGQASALTMGIAAQVTAVEAQTFAPTSRTLLPVVFVVSTNTSWEATQSTPISLADGIARAGATEFARFEDGGTTYGFNALYTEATGTTHELGANGTPMTASLINAGQQALWTSGAPEPYNCAVDPIQVKELYNDPEAKQWLVMPNGDYAAKVGVSPDRYVGSIYGVHIWRTDKMIESTGLFAMMFGRGALGKAYKLYSSPLNPTPAELHVESLYVNATRSVRTTFTTVFHASGLPFTATTNSWMVALCS